LPSSTGLGEALFTIERFATVADATVVEAAALLLLLTGSVVVVLAETTSMIPVPALVVLAT
jgi:hypothetical protein